MGRAPARDRPGRLPQRLSPPRRLSARERRHARLPARGAAPPRAPGRRSPPQALPRGRGRARAPLGPERPAPDRVAAPRGAAASRPQHHGAPGARPGGDAAFAGSELSGSLAQGASADLGGSAAGSGLSARQRLSPARVQRALARGFLTYTPPRSARRRIPPAARLMSDASASQSSAPPPPPLLEDDI